MSTSDRRQQHQTALCIGVWFVRMHLSSISVVLLLLCVTLASGDQLVKSKENLLKKLLSKLKQKVLRRGSQDSWPGPTVVDTFLSPEEAATLIDRYAKFTQQSGHYVQGRGVERKSKYRTSSSIRLPPLGDSLVFDIERRAANLAGFDHAYCEDFQLACYETDALYGLHRDDNDGKSGYAADRAATVLVYLEAPESGGETLFTNQALEQELDLDTKRPLNTEKGALKLFRSYCQQPKRKHVVVHPQVGRAVTWLNWHGDNSTKFARTSTHGACPVHEHKGRKCVIQQWISKSSTNPLRNDNVVALFPMGADVNYQTPRMSDEKCFSDVSAKEGNEVSAVCLHGPLQTTLLHDGPRPGVGAIRIAGGTDSYMYIILPEKTCSRALTASFWARKLPPEMVLFQIENLNGKTLFQVSSGKDKEEPNGLTFALSFPQSGESKQVKVRASDDDWLWYSIAFNGVDGKASFSVHTSRQLLVRETISRTSGPCKSEEECLSLEGSQMKLFSLSSDSPECLAEAESPESAAEISFLVLHRGMLDDEKQVIELSQQVQRYDISK